MTSMAEHARPWRCFWAVPLQAEERESLASFVGGLRAQPGVTEGWRFTDAQTWHLTLAFLGATDPDAIEPMVSRVRYALRDIPRFDAMTGQLGGFPDRHRSRVLWLGVTDSSGGLARLADAVRLACGVQSDEPFRPHLTVARSRDRDGAPLPIPGRPIPRVTLRVEGVVLFRSHLGDGPARHDRLVAVPLGTSSPVEVKA